MLHPCYARPVPRTISQRELRNNSGEIMRALDRGEVFIITRHGVPVGELRPARRHFVSRDLLLETFRAAPDVDLGRLRDDLDTVVDQGVEPMA